MTQIQVDRETFLRNLQQSGLLSRIDFKRATATLADVANPRALARILVDWELLTRFQAELLLVGRAKGFFLGPYKILDQLGQGGMGRVYKAIHQTMNRTVALKVLAPHLVKTPKAQKLFQREVQAAAQLNHPNIVTAFDANEINGRHYLAMEYVSGPTLEQLVRQQGPLPVAMACEIVRQAALGLQHASEHDMLHRDIKPANLLVQPSKNQQSFVVKILDFGLARLNENGGQGSVGSIETKPNTVMGTPDFLSPEQARSLHEIDIRSDLYSLGSTFYYLLTGQVPYPGGTTLEKLIRKSSEDPRPLSDFRQDVPPAVEAVLQRMLARDPVVRYQTPQDLAVALAPHAAACAPNWDSRTRTLPAELPDSPVSDKAEAAETKPLTAEIATLPPSLSPTPLSNTDSQLSLVGGDEHQRRQMRLAFLWSVGIVTSLLVILFLFLFFNS